MNLQPPAPEAKAEESLQEMQPSLATLNCKSAMREVGEWQETQGPPHRGCPSSAQAKSNLGEEGLAPWGLSTPPPASGPHRHCSPHSRKWFLVLTPASTHQPHAAPCREGVLLPQGLVGEGGEGSSWKSGTTAPDVYETEVPMGLESPGVYAGTL